MGGQDWLLQGGADVQQACPACGSHSRQQFFSWQNVPVNSCLLLTSESQARGFPTGDLVLVVCERCGFIANDAFAPELTEYSGRCEESQAFSPHFAAFADSVAESWVQRYALQGTHVVEIGCGKGDFLAAMARHGIGTGVGVDPGVKPDRLSGQGVERLSWVAGTFPEALPDLSDATAVVCRHTLEHQKPVREFVRRIRAALGPESSAVALFELPDAMRVLREGAFWDTYYEHCSYFTTGSLARLFLSCGFDVLSMSLAFDDQYLLLEARAIPADASPRFVADDDVEDILAGATHFRASVAESIEHWRRRITDVSAAGGRVVAWGGSSKAVAFLVALGEAATGIRAVVDVNPYKQNHYLAGTGHAVIAPEDLRGLGPDLVVIMNPIYRSEISSTLVSLGLPECAVEAL